MSELISFSIVLIIRDDKELIDCSLRSIEQLNYPKERFEVIVVDDGSESPMEAELKGPFGYNLRFVYKPRSQMSSRSAARNLGARVSQFRYLVFIDGDHFLGPDILKNYNQYFHVRKNRAVVLGARKHIQYCDKSRISRNIHQNKILLNDVDACSADDERMTLQQFSGKPFNALMGKWHLFWSCNFCIKKELFNDIGRFDERFIRWGFEDVELGYRLLLGGHKYDLIGNYVYHFLPLTPVTPQKYLDWLENLQIFYLKYLDERILAQFALEDVFLGAANLSSLGEPVNWLKSFMRFNERLEILKELKPIERASRKR